MHAEDEWVDLAQVRAYAEALVDTTSAFCGPAALERAGAVNQTS